jgi:hypothetical protein
MFYSVRKLGFLTYPSTTTVKLAEEAFPFPRAASGVGSEEGTAASSYRGSRDAARVRPGPTTAPSYGRAPAVARHVKSEH